MLSAVENSRRGSHEVYGISRYAKFEFKDSELPGSRWRETGYDETAVVPLLVGDGPLRDRRVRFVMCLKKGGTRRYCHNSIVAGSFRTTRKTEPQFLSNSRNAARSCGLLASRRSIGDRYLVRQIDFLPGSRRLQYGQTDFQVRPPPATIMQRLAVGDHRLA